MLRRLPLFLLVVLVGCAGGVSPSGETPVASAGGETAFRDIWMGLDGVDDSMTEQGDRLAVDPIETCSGPFETWFHDFGVRGLACMAAQVVDPAALVAAAPVMPFASGPHVATSRGVSLNLTDPREFGAYDPAFVRWVAAVGIPEGRAARALVQPIYDRHVVRLARIYWLTQQDLERGGFPRTTPSGALSQYAAFLDGGAVPDDVRSPDGGFSVFAFTDQSEALLPRVDLAISNDWEAKYEANTAYGFWLRRRADGTHQLWHDGLRDLLAAFDADWLASN